MKRSSSDLQMSVLTDVRSMAMRAVYSAKGDQTILDEGVDDDEAISCWSENDCQREKRGTNHIFMYLLIGTMTHRAIKLPLLIWRSRHDSFEWINRIFLSNECTLCIVKTETRKGERKILKTICIGEKAQTHDCSDHFNTSLYRFPLFSFLFSHIHLHTSLDQ